MAVYKGLNPLKIVELGILSLAIKMYLVLLSNIDLKDIYQKSKYLIQKEYF